MLRDLCATVAVMATAGCVSIEHLPLTPDRGEAIRGREIAIGARPKPDFTAMTAGSAALGGGLLSGALWISQGNSLVAENGIEDPAVLIARALSQDLREVYGAKVAAGPTAFISGASDDAMQAAREAAGADLLLDIRTLGWALAYYPTSWGKYRVLYSARLRLIDVKRGQVLVEGGCALPQADATPQSPTYDELVSNGAARLKKELAAAAELCIEQYRSASFLMASRKPAAIAEFKGEAAPAAAAAVAAPVASAAAMAASAAPVRALPAGASRMPVAGDTWKYRETRLKAGEPAHEHVVRIKQSAAGSIVDEISINGGSWFEREHRSGAYVVSQGVSLFSPYLTVLGQPDAGRVGIDDVGACPPAMSCGLEARVAGREPVAVAAGTFEATKVVFTHTYRTRVGSGGTRTVTVWYAEDAKRAVKFSSRRVEGAPHLYIETDYDLELTGYQLK